MDNNVSINDRLARLDHKSLYDLAGFFEHQAELCRQEAVKTQHGESERIAMGIDYILSAPRIVMRYLKQGCRLDEALEQTADDLNCPEGSIERSWRRFCQDKTVYEAKRRNTLIIELACMGFSNADIGRKVNLHPNSVSRIISGARKEYHNARSAESRANLLLKGGIPNDDTKFV